MVIENEHTVLTSDGEKLTAISYAYVMGTVFIRDSEDLLIKIKVPDKQSVFMKCFGVGVGHKRAFIIAKGLGLAKICAKNLTPHKEINIVIDSNNHLKEIIFGEDLGLISFYNKLYNDPLCPMFYKPDKNVWLKEVKTRPMKDSYDPKLSKFGWAEVADDYDAAFEMLQKR